MPEKYYRIFLDDENSIGVYFETVKGDVFRFVVKLLSIIDGEEVEILRFDSAHEMPHIDVLDSFGETIQKVWLPHLTNKKALDYAKKNIKEHYKEYREKFLLWKKIENKK